MRLITFCLVLVAISGCTTWGDYNPASLRPVKPTLVSMTGERRVARAGDYFLTSWPYAEREVVIVQNSIRVLGENRKLLLGAIPLGGHDFSVLVPSGSAVLEGQDLKGDKYFALPRGVEYKYGGWSLKTVLGGVVVPSNPSAPARVYWQPPERMNIRVSVQTTDNAALERGRKDRAYEEFTGFGQTITYIGLAQQQIRFVYKEFQELTIRNAFTQEFGFDFVPGREYGYKDSRFIVHRATSTEIEYTVLNAFGH